jgi:hypothetical protein
VDDPNVNSILGHADLGVCFVTGGFKPSKKPTLKVTVIVGPAAGAEERVAIARKLRPDVPVTVSMCTP